MATNQKIEFKFIHGITSSDKIISGKEDTLLAAYTNKEGNAVTFTAPLGLTNEKGFQDAMVAAADKNRGVTIFTSTVGMLVPNCTVTNDNTLTIDSFTVKEGKSRSGTANLPEKVQTVFQNKNNYKNAACTIKSNSINWNRGSQNTNKTQVELSIKDENGASHNSTFNNCEFTITGKVDKTEFELANGSGTTEVYDSSLSKVTVSGAEFYKEGKCYRECNKATTAKRSSTVTVRDVTTFESLNDTVKSIQTSNSYLVTLASVSSLNTSNETDQIVTTLSFPSTKSKVTYKLWKKSTAINVSGAVTVTSDGFIFGLDGFSSTTDDKIIAYTDTGAIVYFTKSGTAYRNTAYANTTVYKSLSTSTSYNTTGNTIEIDYNKDVYYGEKTYTEVWDSGPGYYKAGITTGVPESGTLYTEEGSYEIKSGTRMIQIDSNEYYKKSSSIEEDINTDNTSLSANTISGKTSAPNWITEVKDNTVVKSVIIQ